MLPSARQKSGLGINDGGQTTGGERGFFDSWVMKRAIDMTDDELAAIASRATLHVVK